MQFNRKLQSLFYNLHFIYIFIWLFEKLVYFTIYALNTKKNSTYFRGCHSVTCTFALRAH